MLEIFNSFKVDFNFFSIDNSVFKTNSLNVNDRKDDGQTAYPDEVIRSAGLRDVNNYIGTE